MSVAQGREHPNKSYGILIFCLTWATTFWDGKNVIQFAASKHHIGLYPGPEAVERFLDRLSEYGTSKGTIRIPYREPLPLELIANIAEWCWKQYKV